MQSKVPTTPAVSIPPPLPPAAATIAPAQLEALVEAQEMELRALRAATEDLQETAQYLRTLAHQVRTPLGTILAALGLMESSLPRGVDVAEFTEYCSFITEAVRRLDRVAESACVLGHLGDGSAPSPRARTSAAIAPAAEERQARAVDPLATTAGTLESVLRNVATQPNSDKQPRGHAVEFVGAIPDIPLTPRAASILETALGQVLSNATRYSPASAPAIRVSATSSGSECCVRVRDFGPGLGDDIAGSVFAAFRRGANARGIPGEGVGLFIARRCVRLLRGRIGVANAAAAGESGPPGESPLDATGPGVLAWISFPLAEVAPTPAVE
ncbi:hypothetical protein DB346_16130 [Verrucomicrobia bacterium LW23]|nr:hypothetical protein DB346_16130 [Verrucomicrobia bacterium LW23]